MYLFGIFFYILFVIVPVFFWFGYVRQLDYGEPEPKKILLKLFLWGLLSAAFCIFLGNLLEVKIFNDNPEGLFDPFKAEGPAPLDYIIMLGIAGITEEIVKFIFLKQSIYYSVYFSQINDGVYYGISLALGFAFIENSGYFITAIQKGFSVSELLVLSLVRSLAPLIMHITTTGICGLYLGRKKFRASHSQWLMYKGLLLAIAIHFSYNVLYASNWEWGPVFSLIILISGIVYLFKQIRKPESKMIWKLEYK